MTGRARIPAKWRPSLALVTGLVLATVGALPLAGLFFFRLYENGLIQRTEAELIGQSAVLAAVAGAALASRPGLALGPPIPVDPRRVGDPYRPVEPCLDLAGGPILPRRPDAEPAGTAPDPDLVAFGATLAPVLGAVQSVTLAGFRILDRNGVVVAGRGEVGLSLAHVDEVRAALAGHPASALRTRASRNPPPPVYSISRGTSVRVFTALPIAVDGRVAGVVYASRTPSNIVRQLYEERGKVALSAVAIVAATGAIGFLFWRFVTGPVRELIRRNAAIGSGDRDAVRPLARHGAREFAELSDSFLDMADRLNERSDYLRVFTAHVSHELKSPLTAIRGAAELLRDAPPGSMDEAERQRFLDNIGADAERLSLLVGRLRDLARADTAPPAGETGLATAVADLRPAFPALDIRLEGDPDLVLPMSDENARIVLSHLADNAARHGATAVTVRGEREGPVSILTVRDDGRGVAAANRDRIFAAFFTTRRAEGGTGMGLAIVRSLLGRHGGTITLADGEPGRCTFRIRFGSSHPHAVGQGLASGQVGARARTR